MIDRKHPLSMVQQCRILELSRSSVYYLPQPVSADDLALMRQIDELHLQYPFAGSRMLRDILQLNGAAIGRKHVATLMRRMGIEALYQRPRTTKPHPGHKVFPYLLRNRQITAPNQAWAMDITYIPMRRGPGLGDPAGFGLAAIQQHDGGFLSGCRRGRNSRPRCPGDLEY
jgi:putative transposase